MKEKIHPYKQYENTHLWELINSAIEDLITTQKAVQFCTAFARKTRQRLTLPLPDGSSTISSAGLNYSVRNGKRCDPCDIATKYSYW
jgi:hypothetical protein